VYQATCNEAHVDGQQTIRHFSKRTFKSTLTTGSGSRHGLWISVISK
jgi:hypothetical protein